MRNKKLITLNDHNQIIPNIVNLQGLRLICTKTSERYQRSLSRQNKINKTGSILDMKNKQLRVNKIYFKKKKQKDDQSYFSDYKIKFGSARAHIFGEQIKKNFIQMAKPKKLEDVREDQKIDKINSIQNLIKPYKDNPYQLSLKLQKIKIGQNLTNLSNRQQNKRKAQSKLQKITSTIKMSFSFKDYTKFNMGNNKDTEIQDEPRLDGWAVQSPAVHQIDKRLDIIEYADADTDQLRSYFTQRKYVKQKNRKIDKISKNKA